MQILKHHEMKDILPCRVGRFLQTEENILAGRLQQFDLGLAKLEAEAGGSKSTQLSSQGSRGTDQLNQVSNSTSQRIISNKKQTARKSTGKAQSTAFRKMPVDHISSSQHFEPWS